MRFQQHLRPLDIGHPLQTHGHGGVDRDGLGLG